jgi:hypothetical protein
VHLESGEDVVILEGVAEAVTDPDPGLGERLFASSKAKYGTGSRDTTIVGRLHPSAYIFAGGKH